MHENVKKGKTKNCLSHNTSRGQRDGPFGVIGVHESYLHSQDFDVCLYSKRS